MIFRTLQKRKSEYKKTRKQKKWKNFNHKYIELMTF